VVRQVKITEFAQAAITRASRQFQNLAAEFDSGIMWQLQRSPLDMAQLIPESNPAQFLIQTNAWRGAGLPSITIRFTKNEDGSEIEINCITLR
jgi:hypothetical protein